jgi:nicotinamidase-related amidase
MDDRTDETAALVVIDLQRAFDDTGYWGRRNNPDCESNVAALVAEWQRRELPLVLVRHDSIEANSPLRPDSPGNAFKAELNGCEPDLLVVKQTNSCFYGRPNLQEWLDARHLQTLILCGISTNHCVETTARMGANLGFRIRFVLGATHTFDRTGPDGSTLTADELARATATSLHGEFAEIVATTDLLERRSSDAAHIRAQV